jgi:hypothetical protein
MRIIPCILALAGLGLALAACQTNPPELSNQQVCLSHYENDPVERERCRLSPETSRGSPPDVSPHELPVRTGQMSE